MKRSEINAVIHEASAAFARHHWALPPQPQWDVTDFGLGNFRQCGLTLINLAEQKEYCEKLMYVTHGQVTPSHCHAQKKEDIICRFGTLSIELSAQSDTVSLQINGIDRCMPAHTVFTLEAGERITMTRGIIHRFWASSDYAILGEVSTANDDTNDNHFTDDQVGRYSVIEEDEAAFVTLVSDQ